MYKRQAVEHPELVMRVDTFNGAGMSCSTPVMLLLETLWRDTILPALSASSLDPARVHNYYADPGPVSYTHLRAHETVLDLVCRLLLEKKKVTITNIPCRSSPCLNIERERRRISLN